MSEETRKQYEDGDFYSEYTDLEFIGIYAKCGIHHNCSEDEEKLERRLKRLSDSITKLEHAHSKIEEADREGYNMALDEAAKLIWQYRHQTGTLAHEINEELKKLRR